MSTNQPKPQTSQMVDDRFLYPAGNCTSVGHWCTNGRMLEHESGVRSTPCKHLTVHWDKWGCAPVWDSLTIEMKMKEKTSREILEASLNHKYRDKCVGASSINLLPKESAFLRD